jgi:ABC-type uncharacterized transport system involved in gliding motility auxiliary subunit
MVKTGKQSWAETGKIEGRVQYDSGQDKEGPISLAVAVAKKTEETLDTADTGLQSPMSGRKKEARLVVFGDSDFVTNTYISFSGNRDLFLNCINWLAEEEELISIRPRGEEHRPIHLTQRGSRSVFYISLLAIPIGVLGSGIGVWWKRRSIAG